ncbi:MAG: hypothetical protein CM1200mP20_02720 [Pseudomonadota bacterium]|nr:MAG: hypothetical protein CM1200mP20_02720 [Pseudomonadota bacterium]
MGPKKIASGYPEPQHHRRRRLVVVAGSHSRADEVADESVRMDQCHAVQIVQGGDLDKVHAKDPTLFHETVDQLPGLNPKFSPPGTRAMTAGMIVGSSPSASMVR